MWYQIWHLCEPHAKILAKSESGNMNRKRFPIWSLKVKLYLLNALFSAQRTSAFPAFPFTSINYATLHVFFLAWWSGASGTFWFIDSGTGWDWVVFAASYTALTVNMLVNFDWSRWHTCSFQHFHLVFLGLTVSDKSTSFPLYATFVLLPGQHLHVAS